MEGHEDRAALRYAVASNESAADSEFTTDAAYAGPHLLVVAHGIQNLSSPAKASAVAVGEFRALDARVDAGTDTGTDTAGLVGSLERGIEGLRGTFRDFLAQDPRWNGTGAVLTAMLWQGTRAAVAHIGSTRAYMLRGGELTQLTRDHTIGPLLVEAGTIRPDELGSDPRHSSVLVRWLDGEPGEPADVFAHDGAVGDRHLLCAGDIDRVMPPATLRDILRDTAGDTSDVVDTVVGMAFPAEEHGSLTCIVADVVTRPR